MAKKAPQAFRTISEVSDWLDTPTHVLRFWESKFSQVKPVKRAGGRRYYRPSDMELLGGIKVLLHDEGQTIKSVQDMMKEHGVGHVSKHSPEFDFPTRSKRSRKKSQTSDTSKKTAETATGSAVETEAPQNVTAPVDTQSNNTHSKDKQSEDAQNAATQQSTVDATPTKREDASSEVEKPVPSNGDTQVAKDTSDVSPKESKSVTAGSDAAADNASVKDALTEGQRSTEEDARSFITAAVSQRKPDHAIDDLPSSDRAVGFAPRKTSAETGTRSTRKLNVQKSASKLNPSELALVEDLYYQLRKVRNRIRRSL